MMTQLPFQYCWGCLNWEKRSVLGASGRDRGRSGRTGGCSSSRMRLMRGGSSALGMDDRSRWRRSLIRHPDLTWSLSGKDGNSVHMRRYRNVVYSSATTTDTAKSDVISYSHLALGTSDCTIHRSCKGKGVKAAGNSKVPSKHASQPKPRAATYKKPPFLNARRNGRV